MLLVAPIIGAILYRLRGGWLNDLIGWGQKTQASRAVWAIPTALFIWETWSLPAWEIAALSVSVFASMALLGTGEYLDPAKPHPIIDPMGALRNAIAIAPAVPFAPIPCLIYVITGTLHAQIYRLSLNATGATQAAECGVGGLTWLAIALLKGAV